MPLLARPFAFALAGALLCAAWMAGAPEARGQAPTAYGEECTAPASAFFVEEVWAKVASTKCLTCHKAGGDAEESDLVLLDPSRSLGKDREDALRRNQGAFVRLAMREEEGRSRLLRKVVGELDHGGEDVLSADSSEYAVLAEFVRRLTEPDASVPIEDLTADDARAFFDGVEMMSDRRLLRRATLSLCGRLPTEDELSAVDGQGLEALPSLLDAMMREEAFYDRLREGFDDILLTSGYGDGAESALSYSHFSETRHWTQKHDLSHIEDEKERQRARYKLADDYRDALFQEPLRLIEHVVRNDRPFTEIVTADYILVSPYTARGYGIFDEVKDRFESVDDPFEYVPVRLEALVGRNRQDDMESPTGFYPHAGLLSTFQYLRRYPTTETNRNRLRARMYYQHFLGVDALALAARVSDAAAATAQFEIPTMQASECVVCHRTLDPVASLFQDYYDLKGVYGRRRDGWYEDMFQAGFEGEAMPTDERWRSLQWLGERTAEDPRFATATVDHVYFILTGSRTSLPPKDLDDPLHEARLRAYRVQRREVERLAERFVASNFDLKTVFEAWILSDFYRADRLSAAADSEARRTELECVGVAQILSPGQLERKVAAVFGQPWGRLEGDLAMLYGGIDYQEVTERATDPSGAMGAIQRMMANEVACRHVLDDFSKPAAERTLFPEIEPAVVPGASEDDDRRIRETIAHLHWHILGREDAVDSEEVDRTFALLAGIVADAAADGDYDKREIYACRRERDDVPTDEHYTIRAWRGVVTYLLRRQEFLYQ